MGTAHASTACAGNTSDTTLLELRDCAWSFLCIIMHSIMQPCPLVPEASKDLVGPEGCPQC